MAYKIVIPKHLYNEIKKPPCRYQMCCFHFELFFLNPLEEMTRFLDIFALYKYYHLGNSGVSFIFVLLVSYSRT